MYTMNDWMRDGTFHAELNEEVSPEIVEQMRNCVPPETMTRSCLQVGEAYSHNWETGEALYTTFEMIESKWLFTGYQPSKRIRRL